MTRRISVCVLALAAALCAPPIAAQTVKRNLASSCIATERAAYQDRSATEVVASGSVTCPSADLVGFPPKIRRHDRSSRITLSAGPGREICPGTVPTVRDESSNSGTRGNFAFADDRSSVSMDISCRGAAIGQGRTWYRAELVAQSCAKVTDQVLLDVTRDCAYKSR